MWSVVRGCGDTITLWRSLCISSVMTYLDGAGVKAKRDGDGRGRGESGTDGARGRGRR